MNSVVSSWWLVRNFRRSRCFQELDPKGLNRHTSASHLSRTNRWWDYAMECRHYLRNVHDKLDDDKNCRERSRVHQSAKETLKRIFSVYVLRTEKLVIRVVGSGLPWFCKSQKTHKSTSIFIKQEIQCANDMLRHPDRSRPSSIMEENILQKDDIEIEDDKKGHKTVRFWRNKKFALWSFAVPDKAMCPIQMRNVDVMGKIQTSNHSVPKNSSMTCGSIWRMSHCLKSRPGLHKYKFLRARCVAGIQVDGRFTKIQKHSQTRQYTVHNLDKLLKKRNGDWILAQRCVDGEQRLLQDDYWFLFETGQGYGFCFVVHCEGWQSREISRECHFHWCQWGTVRYGKYRHMRTCEATTCGSHRSEISRVMQSVWPEHPLIQHVQMRTVCQHITLHSLTSFHYAKMSDSSFKDLCPKHSVIHASCLVPCRTWHWSSAQVFCHRLLQFVSRPFLNTQVCFPRSVCTLRWFTTEMRFFEYPISHRLWVQKNKLDRNRGVEHQDQILDKIMEDDYQSSITDGVVVQMESLSYIQLLIHSAYDSTKKVSLTRTSKTNNYVK